MQSIPKIFNQLILFFMFSIVLTASEILYENNWIRIITGDMATRLTRGISEQPQPKIIDEAVVKAIFNKMDIAEPSSAQLEAWILGLKQYGWAQQENEPEHESYRALQIIVVDENKLELLVKIFELVGQTSETRFSLEGKQLSFKNIDVPEILNQDVFYTVHSPALFVLMQ